MTTRRWIKAVIGVLAMTVGLASVPTTASAMPDIDNDPWNSANAYAELQGAISSPWSCPSQRANRVISVHEGQIVNLGLTYDCESFSVLVNLTARDIDPANGPRPTRVHAVVDVQVFDHMAHGVWSDVPERCAHESYGFVDDTLVFRDSGNLTVSCSGMSFAFRFQRFYMSTSQFTDCWEFGLNCPL